MTVCLSLSWLSVCLSLSLSLSVSHTLSCRPVCILSVCLAVSLLSLSILPLSCVLLLSQKLSLLELRHTVQSLRGFEARLSSQKALLDAKMAVAASPPPPPPPPAMPYEDDARSVGSTVKISLFKSDLRSVQDAQLRAFNNKGVFSYIFILFLCLCVCVFQDKSKEKSSRFDTLRHSLAGMIRPSKVMLGSSTSVRFLLLVPTLIPRQPLLL